MYSETLGERVDANDSIVYLRRRRMRPACSVERTLMLAWTSTISGTSLEMGPRDRPRVRFLQLWRSLRNATPGQLSVGGMRVRRLVRQPGSIQSSRLDNSYRSAAAIPAVPAARPSSSPLGTFRKVRPPAGLATMSASSSQRHGGVHYGMTEGDRAVAVSSTTE
jgi:hypothetical protein